MSSEGTTYRRKRDGRWCAALRYERGARPTVRYAGSEAEAEKLLAQMRRERDAGARSGTMPRLADYLSSWLDDVKAPHVRPHTLEVYEDQAGLLIGKIGHVRLNDLTPARIRRCQSDLLKDSLSARYVAAVMARLDSALRDAVRDRILTWNPCEAVRRPSPEKREMQTLTLTQVQALLAASRESGYCHHATELRTPDRDDGRAGSESD